MHSPVAADLLGVVASSDRAGSVAMNPFAPRLELAAISKAFPGVRALDSVSITARAGEVLALMGENGAGKSTLLKVMTGAHQPDSGTIAIDGKPVVFASPHDSRGCGIRVVYQEPDIVPGTTIAENIFLGDLPRRAGRMVDWKRLNADASDLLANFRFGRALDPGMSAERLSPAQRQLVEIVRALRGDLKVLALDEPTSSLSAPEAEDLFSLIADLKTRSVALIYVSHRMKEILRLADRVAVLRDGKLVGVEPVSELDDASLIRMMVGRKLSDVMKRTCHTTSREILRVTGLSSDLVHDIDLTVRAGEVVGLAGLIGAGRTELAKTIFGALPKTSGTIAVDGCDTVIDTPRHAITAGIAYAPEERKADALLLGRSVLENASLAVLRGLCRFRVIDRRKERAIFGHLAERLRIKTPSLDQEVGKLSGGNQQKVVLARWLAAAPKLLILDEPTRGIDVGAKSEIYALIEQLARDGMAILLISSELPEILGLSDRVVCLQRGRITGELDGRGATEESVLNLCMAFDIARTASEGDIAS